MVCFGRLCPEINPEKAFLLVGILPQTMKERSCPILVAKGTKKHRTEKDLTNPELRRLREGSRKILKYDFFDSSVVVEIFHHLRANAVFFFSGDYW